MFNEKLGKNKEEGEIALVNPEVLHDDAYLIHQANTMKSPNVQIIWRSPETSVDTESCLSFPFMFGKVTRNKQITVKYQDLKGQINHAKFFGLHARGVAHEMDHLNQVLFIDHFNQEDLSRNFLQLNQWVKEYGEDACR